MDQSKDKTTGEEKVEEKVVKPSPTVGALVTQTLAEIPGLSLRAEQVELVWTILSAYIGTPEIPVISVPREVALTELELTKSWTLDQIEDACVSLVEALDGELNKLKDRFYDETGTDVEGNAFESFESRYKGELAEHDKLVSAANKILAEIRSICGQFGIENPDPALEKKPAKGKLKKGFEQMTQSISGAAKRGVDLLVEVKTPEESDEEILSWMTDPLLDPASKDMKILELVNARLATSEDIQSILDSLTRIGLDRVKLSEIMRELAVVAREQIDASAKIVTNVKESYRAYMNPLKAIYRFNDTVMAVLTFFGVK